MKGFYNQYFFVPATQLAASTSTGQVKQVTQIPNPNLLNELDIYDIKYSSTGNIYILVSYIGNFKIDSVKFNAFPDNCYTIRYLFN